MLLGQLVGARVRVATTAAAATVVDAGFEQTRTKDWLVTRLAVRERTGPLSRRAPVQVLGWHDVRGTDVLELLGPVGQTTRQLLASFDNVKAADVASVLRDLPVEIRREVAEAMGDERLADIIEELPEDDQKDLLTYLDEARAADVLEAMDPDDAADLLGELPPDTQDRLLNLMEPEESEPVRRLLQYSFDTAGGLMTTGPGGADARTPPSPRRWPACVRRNCRRPWPPWCSSADRRRPPPPVATWVACTCNGCSGNRRSSWWRASSTARWRGCPRAPG